ncbi:hypothetical protein F5Y07DRAFT_379758 [Xylaria sp. FL0933]|nr:hypothetical protein F5Y07DRAFT_379758 [Xylaria sp. FL0933]
MTTTTLLKLPWQPLPASAALFEGIVVTIWFVFYLAFAVAFYRLLNRKPKSAWPEFKSILIGCSLLFFWYFFIVLDRWLHYGQNRVSYGYIFVLPIVEISRIASTIYFLWGTYTIIWRELEDRFPRTQQGYWWFTARIAIFVVGLISVYYFTLFIAHVSVWVRFLSLNTIADVATKRTGFEIGMNASFVIFGAITLAAACASLLWKAREIDGRIRHNRICLILATSLLFVRSIIELALTLRALGPESTRRSLQPIKDVAYGIVSLIYLGLMYFTAYVLSSKFDRGSREARLVESDIRSAVLNQLQEETDDGRRKSRPFGDILDLVGNKLEGVLRDGPLSCNIEMSSDYKHQIARECLESLRAQYGSLDPKDSANEGSQNSSRISSLFGRQSVHSRKSLGAGLRPSTDQLLPQASRLPPMPSLTPIAPQRHVNGLGADIHRGVSRSQSLRPSVNSTPSRWAPSVSEYTETIAEVHETSPVRRPFHERITVLQQNGAS